MRPDDPNMKNNSLFIPQRPSDSGAYSMSQPTASRSQQAVADLTRAQIESIYDGDENATMPVTTAVADSQSQQPQDDAASTPVTSLASDSSYAKVHNDEAATKLSGDWQEYHSAWQKYYQQYFQYYYAGHLQQAHEALKVQTEKTAQLETKQNYERTPEEATNELRCCYFCFCSTTGFYLPMLKPTPAPAHQCQTILLSIRHRPLL